MTDKETKTTGNAMLTFALLGPLGSLFGAPRPRSERVPSKPEPTPRRPR